ncbi:MAG: porin [Minwuia sp.]|nr:porin [Minwuia sp.]
MNHKHLLAGVAATALLTAGSAFAASHSGDQLQAQAAMIDALSKKVEQLSANQGGVSGGVKGVSLKVSGQVNRAVMFVSDGNDKSAFNYVDNDASSTRVRWDAVANVSDSTEVGTRLEMEMESNTSAGAVLNGNAGGNAFVARHAYVYIKGGFGTLTTGQQGEATEGLLHSSFNYASLAAINPEDTTGIANAGVNFLSFGDGGREDALRYDTPNFGGAKASISTRDNGEVTAAIRYAGQVGGMGVLAALGYEAGSAGNDAIVAGSFGINFGPVALNGSFGDELDDNNNDRFYYALGLAHKGSYVDMGPTSLGVQYMSNNGGADAGQGNIYSVGFGLVQGVAAGAEAFAQLTFHGGNEGAVGDAIASMVGMRVKF